MEIISGYLETLDKKQFINMKLVESYWYGQILAENKWYFFAQIGMKSYALSAHENEADADLAMTKFLVELTPEMERQDDTNS